MTIRFDTESADPNLELEVYLHVGKERFTVRSFRLDGMHLIITLHNGQVYDMPLKDSHK